MVVKMYNNEEINGRIYAQLCNLFTDSLLKENKDRFFNHAFCVMHKLHATNYHMNNYIKIESEQYKRALKQFKKNKDYNEEQLTLIFELEAFIIQIKSSLDMLVKLLLPITGNNIISTNTFGNKGEKLIKGLNKYKEKNGVRIDIIEALINLIKSDQSIWLEYIITIRDEISHYKSITNYMFEPIQLKNGLVGVKKPSFKGMNTIEFLKTVYNNNLTFHQDFMCLVVLLASPPGFILIKQDKKEAIGKFDKYGKYVEWAIGIDKKHL